MLRRVKKKVKKLFNKQQNGKVKKNPKHEDTWCLMHKQDSQKCTPFLTLLLSVQSMDPDYQDPAQSMALKLSQKEPNKQGRAYLCYQQQISKTD